MASLKPKKGFSPVAETAAFVMSPLLQKKAGLNMQLIENWAEIIGKDIADKALPLKISWPRQSGTEVRAGGLKAGMLVISCFGYAALRVQHETAEIIGRVNRFFGYQAIDRVRIEQKVPPEEMLRSSRASDQGGLLGGLMASFAGSGAVSKPAEAQSPRPLPADIRADIEAIENEALRNALARLGGRIERR